MGKYGRDKVKVEIYHVLALSNCDEHIATTLSPQVVQISLP